MTFFTANMIKNFPGSDDSRGTTTRVNYSIPFPVDDTYSPEMRPDEFPGPIGEALAYANLTRQTISVCKIVDVDGITDLNSAFTIDQLNEFQAAIPNLNTAINDKIVDITTSLGGQIYNFVITKLDIVKNYTNTSGLHNQAGSHTVFVTWNYDVIIYGQFTPNPLVQPDPEPQVCQLYDFPSVIQNDGFAAAGNGQMFDSTDPNLTGTGKFALIFTSGNILINQSAYLGVVNPPNTFSWSENNPLGLEYIIPSYSFNGGGGGNVKFKVQYGEANTSNWIDIHEFTLIKGQSQNGYIPFNVNQPGGWSPLFVRVIITSQLTNPAAATITPGFGGRMFFGISNQYCLY